MSSNVQPPNFEHGRDLRARAFAFACQVVTFCDSVHQRGGLGRMLVPQLVGSSTSISANLEEARAAESDRDFVSKCSIALKEGREAWTRLRVFEACHLGDGVEVARLVREADELVAIVTTVLRNKRRNMERERRRPRS